MNWKKSTPLFLVAYCIFLCLPNITSGQSLNFYSQIDDNNNTVATQLTKRHLQEYQTFRDFGKHCRREIPQLDTKPIETEVLEQLSRGEFSRLYSLLNSDPNNPTSLTSQELNNLSACLVSEYDAIKNRSQDEQTTFEKVNSIGVYMDGDNKNSDFDIVTDINKINKIIFTTPYEYTGKKNNSKDLLSDFLSGKKANKPGENTTKNPETITVDNVRIKDSAAQNPINQENVSRDSANNALPWAQTCNIDGTVGTTSVSNMVDANFMRDLNFALQWGGNSVSNSNGVDYSKNFVKNSQNNNQNAEIENEEDFFSKLPCNDIFCIKIWTTITSKDLLVGGNSYAIESILDAHIKKTEKISWSDLSAQKMTNNSFQLPFLNTKFSQKIAGGAVHTHSLPQVTKTIKDEETLSKKDAEFENILRCAAINANIPFGENASNTYKGGVLKLNQAHNLWNVNNSILPASTTEIENSRDALGCQMPIKTNISTQFNELQAFSFAMTDIIKQILDTEKRLDNIKTQ